MLLRLCLFRLKEEFAAFRTVVLRQETIASAVGALA